MAIGIVGHMVDEWMIIHHQQHLLEELLLRGRLEATV